MTEPKSYGVPVFQMPSGDRRRLARVSRRPGQYDEAWLQSVLYECAECLPVDEIDSAYSPIVPVCRELAAAGAGFLDILYATPEARLAIVETKLWRNPQARREVIGQVLDYAKVISKWSAEELDSHVRAAKFRRGDSVHAAITTEHPGVDPVAFHDDLNRNLRLGRFLLLIVGDGIREGIGEIAEFLERYATMDFTLGLVEMSIFEDATGGRLVVPRVVSRTETIKRWVVTVPGLNAEVRPEEPEEAAREELEEEGDEFYEQFWKEFVKGLKLDDTSQARPRETKIGLAFLPMPPSGGVSWVSLFFNQNKGGVGAFLTFRRGAFADSAYKALELEREQIEKEFGSNLEWRSDGTKHKIVASRHFGELRSSANREPIREYLSDVANRFVNVFRSRLKRISEAIG